MSRDRGGTGRDVRPGSARRCRGTARRGDPLVDVRRRVGRGEGVRRPVPARPAAPGWTPPSPAAPMRAPPPSTAPSAAIRRPRCSSTPASSSTIWSRTTCSPTWTRRQAAQNWKAILPAAFVQAVTRNGHVYAVPVNIHGQNWLFYSNAALAKAGAQPPTNWDDLFPALDKLKAAGLIPLAFSGQKNWERNLFNNVHGRTRRARHVRRLLGQARRRHGEGPRIPQRSPRPTSACATTSIPAAPAATGTTRPAW